jgi:hypothetical protein
MVVTILGKTGCWCSLHGSEPVELRKCTAASMRMVSDVPLKPARDVLGVYGTVFRAQGAGGPEGTLCQLGKSGSLHVVQLKGVVFEADSNELHFALVMEFAAPDKSCISGFAWPRSAQETGRA